MAILTKRRACLEEEQKRDIKNDFDIMHCLEPGKQCRYYSSSENPDQPDDVYMACALGLRSFFPSAKSAFESFGMRYYRSTDADLDSLFKQLYLECKEMQNNACIAHVTLGKYSGLNTIMKYLREYFDRHYSGSVWKCPEELPYYLGVDCCKNSDLLFDETPIIDFLIGTGSTSRKSLMMTELWKDEDYQKVLEKHGVEWPVCIRYNPSVKPFKKDKMLVLMEDGTVVSLSRLLNESIEDEANTDSEEFRFYLFGELDEDVWRDSNETMQSKVTSLINDLRTAIEGKGKPVIE